MIDIGISLIEASIKYNIAELIDVEQKLFLISLVLENSRKLNISLQLGKEITIFKEIKFTLKKLNPLESIIIISGNNYTLDPYKRIITFIDDGVLERKFVYNFGYFKRILKQKHFKLFECLGNNKSTDSNYSLISEYNESEIYNYYCNEKITEIKKIETNTKQLILKEFDTKSDCPMKISDLSLNMKYYNNTSIEKEIKYLDDLARFKYYKINPFLYDDSATILYYFGIKGCGKTTQLLNSSLELHNQSDINMPRLYIDYQIMKKEHKLRKIIFKKRIILFIQ